MVVSKSKEDEINRLRKLTLLLQEAQKRGIDTRALAPKNEVLKWKTDENNYWIRNDGKIFKPSEAQRKFISSTARFVALISGRGGGKTAAGAQKAGQKIMAGYSGAVLNPDFENFKESTWAEFRQWIPWDMVHPRHQRMRYQDWTPREPFVLTFLNGARVICKGLKDPDSARGPNINWLWYDEAGRDRTGLSWKLAIASVRVGDNPQAWITTTPAGKTHWIYEFFLDEEKIRQAREEYQKAENREYVEVFFTSILENKENIDVGFFASLIAAYPSGYLKEQEIFGRFVDPEGVLGNRDWFNGKIIPTCIDGSLIKKKVRFWDLAGTEKKIAKRKAGDPDETVGTLVSYDGTNYYVEHQIGGQWEWFDVKKKILETTLSDGPFVDVFVEQEPASGGKNQIAELDDFIRREISGHPGIKGYRPEGDRVMLANYWFSLAAQGKIFLVDGEWVGKFLDQLSVFPEGKHDDRITSVSGAIVNLTPIVKKWKKIEFIAV